MFIKSLFGSLGDMLFAYMAAMGFVLFESDTDLSQITELLKKQDNAFTDFKTANEKRLEEIEKEGKANQKTLAEIDKLNDTINKLTGELKSAAERMDDIEKKGNRPGNPNDPSPEVTEHKTAFSKFVRTGDDKGLADLEAKVMQTGSDVDGGYLVPAEVDSAIDRVATMVSVMRSLCDVKSIGSKSIKMRVKTSGLSARWVGEGEAGGETVNPKYATIEINAEELEAEPWIYNSTLDDAEYDLEADVTDEAGIAFGEAEGVAYVSGSGVKRPRGILGYPTVPNASYVWGSIGYIASGAASNFAGSNPADALITLVHSLKSVYRVGAVMVMNDATLGAIRQMKDGSGAFYLFNADPTGNFAGFILGVPVRIDDNMPDIAANSFPIAYGNFKRAYRIVDRKGTALIRDNITEKGTTKYNFRRRVGGGIKQYEAIKLFKIAVS
jgi:HK97 family phage major capsid protein